MENERPQSWQKRRSRATEIWTRLVSQTVSRLSHPRQQVRAPSAFAPSFSSAPNDSTMQPCWPTCEPELSMDRSSLPTVSTPCQLCFEPSSPIVMTSMALPRLDRQSSDPLSVPASPIVTPPMNSPEQAQGRSYSSGYESAFGNGLSPTTDYWKSGIYDIVSNPSSTSDELNLDPDQSIFDGSGSETTDGPDEEVLDDDDLDDFEVLSFSAPPESSVFFKEFHHTTAGEQNHRCNCCSESLLSGASLPVRRCFYFGKLYCCRCHVNEVANIPAKIINSWDMRLYPVCRRAKSILQMNYYQGIFDIQQDNENLYQTVPQLAEIRTLRTQFQHCQAHLLTCKRIKKDFYENLFEDFMNRDYLYQSVQLYSINDLLTLKKIAAIMEKACLQAKKHIHECQSCSAKGFTCEICKNRAHILYAFDDAKMIGQCPKCSNVYHRHCWEAIEQDCPRCYRLIQRRIDHETQAN